MRPENAGPYRKVVNVDERAIGRHGRRVSATWYLECGHTLRMRGSVPVAKRAHCPRCQEAINAKLVETPPARKCRVCGCTEQDCSGCIERTGKPCHWIELDLCSACEGKG
jgi:hypothetical protein